MFALTIDQQRSRESDDAVPELLDALASRVLVRSFERTAGDEVQGLTDDPATAVDLALDVVRRGGWWIGIGIGSVDEPIPTSVRASRGPALVLARVAVERAHRSSVGLAVEGESAHHAETAMLVLARLVHERSEEGHAAVDMMRTGVTQKEGAARLRISAQAMSRRLQVAGWADERRLRDLAIHLMREAAQPG